MSEKYYRLTKVKRHTNPEGFTFVPVGTTMTGYLPDEELPQENLPFLFISDVGFNNGVRTSLVEEVDKDIEPGVTFIKTLNSIYKLEELQDND